MRRDAATSSSRHTRADVQATARARLALLEHELARVGMVASTDESTELTRPRPATDTPETSSAAPATVAPAGRHCRGKRRRHETTRTAAAGLVPATLRGRVRLDGAHLAVLLVLVVAAGAMAAVAMWQRGSSEQVPMSAPESGGPLVSASPSGAAVVASATPSGAQGVAATGKGGVVIVDVAGKVRRPGIVELPSGSRIADALRRAGGAKSGVNLTSLNLARVLVDGEQILVGVKPAPVGAAAAAGGDASAPRGPAAGDLININTATESQLEDLPGVGPVTAEKIVRWRTENQAFSSVDELLEVDGIGEKTLAEIVPRATL